MGELLLILSKQRRYALPMYDQCHQCGYDLTGLPRRGVCPECGRRYDTAVRSHGHARHEPFLLRHIKPIGLGAFALFILVCGGALSLASDKPMGVVMLTLVIAAVPAFGAFVYWWAGRQEEHE